MDREEWEWVKNKLDTEDVIIKYRDGTVLKGALNAEKETVGQYDEVSQKLWYYDIYYEPIISIMRDCD